VLLTAAGAPISAKSACEPRLASDALQSEVVVYRMAESLLAAEIPLSCLNRYVPSRN
jgi:hypothetical protein